MRNFCLFKSEMRLRIIANSDSRADQHKKLLVRDRVLRVAHKKPLDTSAIVSAARGLDPSAQIELGIFYFGGYASPAIQLTLGKGAGHNWWGILYPSAFDQENDSVVFQSWILTMLRSWGWI